MKTIICFSLLVAGLTAVPHHETQPINWLDERLISGSIENAIQKISQSIQDAGLDPLLIEEESFAFELPVPVIFNVLTALDELVSTGLSNIVIHRVNYNLITSRLNFDIELPLILFYVGNAEADLELFGYKFGLRTSGKIEIQRIRVVGEVRVNVGIISGISIRSIKINLTLGDITSDVNLVIQDSDYSDLINKFVGKTCPDTIKAYNKEINELLEIVLLDLINEYLSK